MAGLFDLEFQPGEVVVAANEDDVEDDDHVDNIEVDETVDVRRRVDDPQLASESLDIVPINADTFVGNNAPGFRRVGPVDFELLKVLGKAATAKCFKCGKSRRAPTKTPFTP